MAFCPFMYDTQSCNFVYDVFFVCFVVLLLGWEGGSVKFGYNCTYISVLLIQHNVKKYIRILVYEQNQYFCYILRVWLLHYPEHKDRKVPHMMDERD